MLDTAENLGPCLFPISVFNHGRDLSNKGDGEGGSVGPGTSPLVALTWRKVTPSRLGIGVLSPVRLEPGGHGLVESGGPTVEIGKCRSPCRGHSEWHGKWLSVRAQAGPERGEIADAIDHVVGPGFCPVQV